MYRRLVDYHLGGEDEELLCNGCDQLNRDTSVVLYNSKFDPEDRVGRTSTNYQKLD